MYSRHEYYFPFTKTDNSWKIFTTGIVTPQSVRIYKMFGTSWRMYIVQYILHICVKLPCMDTVPKPYHYLTISGVIPSKFYFVHSMNTSTTSTEYPSQGITIFPPPSQRMHQICFIIWRRSVCKHMGLLGAARHQTLSWQPRQTTVDSIPGVFHALPDSHGIGVLNSAK